MKRELARQEDGPRDIIIRLTGSQKSLSEYHKDEINRLNEELEERDRRIESQNEELTKLRTIKKHVILTCPLKLDVIMIFQCNTRLDRGDCVKKDCFARKTLQDELFYKPSHARTNLRRF